MDHKYHLIKQLIEKVADYEKSLDNEQEMNLAGLCRFVMETEAEGKVTKRTLAGDLEPEIQTQGNKQETAIAILVTFIYRYAKLYAKKVLQESVISTLDDFSYLILLLTHESLSKTELIQKNIHEKTTGMEIIRRLIKQKLIYQVDSLQDKRSKRVGITNEGKQALFSVLGPLEDVSTIMTGNLSPAEKSSLNAILKKLDHFHFDIYISEKNTALPEIIEKRLVKK